MRNPWIVALAGTITMICLGTVYSWSLFTQPLIASFGWSNSTTTFAFSLAIFFLGVGAIIGGWWQDRSGPRAVTITGAVLWGLGNILAGLGTAQLGAWWIYLTYGIIGGTGLGLAYVTPVATVTKWFPKRRGLGSGMVVMGFGLGAFFYNNLIKSIPSFREAAKQAQDVVAKRAAHAAPIAMGAQHIHTIMMIFTLSGVVFLIVGGLAAAFLSNPPESSSSGAQRGSESDFTLAQALATPQFYSLWLMLFLNVTAGILFISNAVNIMRELTGAELTRAVAVYGFIALFNGLGRFFWGAISDRLGRNLAYVLIYGTQVAIFFFVRELHSMSAVAAMFAIVLLDYGGGFGTMPSFTADYFGTRYMGIIYGWILLAWGVGGIAGPVLVAKVKDHTGSFSGALPIVAVILLVATILPIITRKPKRPEPPPGFSPIV